MEQSTGISELKTAVGQISDVTQSTAGHADASATGARELIHQTASRRETVEQLNVFVGLRTSAEPSDQPSAASHQPIRSEVAAHPQPAKTRPAAVITPKIPARRAHATTASAEKDFWN